MAASEKTDDTVLLGTTELRALVACPVCASSLPLDDALTVVRCPSCATEYPRLAHAWDLTPPREQLTQGAWQAWEQLQANGIASYEADPTNNLGVGPRDDFDAFARFCGLDGLVLDVGCGPQPWPSHFSTHAPGTRFLGIDPLVGTRQAGYLRVRGLAEHLPFADDAFDHVVMATTLDHFVDPLAALKEAERVRAPDGGLEVWIGHKDPGAPRPQRSPEWYAQLEVPEGADDVFHVKRLSGDEAQELFARAGLRVLDREEHRVDAWRTNFFFRLASGSR